MSFQVAFRLMIVANSDDFKNIVELITVNNDLSVFFQREYDKQEDTVLDASTTEEDIHICTVRSF